MMRRSGGVLAVTVAALLVCSSADPHQEQDSSEQGTGDRFDGNEHKARHLAPLGGGGTLVRQVRESRPPSWMPFMAARRNDYSPYGGKRDLWPLVAPMEYGGYYAVGLPKRNFDEIDRSGLDNFVRKRNFDEIDQTSMPFPYKRFVHLYGPNFLGAADYDKKRNRADFPMDEIDVSAFPIGSKRSSEGYPLFPHNLR